MRQLCNVGLNSYMLEPDFIFNNTFIGAYPLYNGQSRNGFRSQNEECLMRNMTSKVFCRVCEENLWLQFFFSRISCIDDILLKEEGENIKIEIILIKIGQFRVGGPIHNDFYSIKWFKNSQQQFDLDQKFIWSKKRSEILGQWQVEVKYSIDQIRNDPLNKTIFKKQFLIN